MSSFNRTLKSKIFKSLLLRSSLNWVTELDKLVDEYNNTKHTTIGMTPKEASKPEHERFLLETVYWNKNNRQRGVAKFKVGDAVRISRKSHIFNRGYTPQFSVEVFFVSSVNNKIPITYLLRDFKHEVSCTPLKVVAVDQQNQKELLISIFIFPAHSRLCVPK